MNDWLEGVRECQLVDLSNINTIPLEYFAHINDEFCLYNETMRMLSEIEIPAKVNRFSIPGEIGFVTGAHDFIVGWNNDHLYALRL